MGKEMRHPSRALCSKHKTRYSVAQAPAFEDNPILAKFQSDFAESRFRQALRPLLFRDWEQMNKNHFFERNLLNFVDSESGL
jgi:hypothetical protein